jgi:Skp family chaperone for outer membrane proteins
MEMMVWNIVLTAVLAVMGFLLKGKFDEIDRIGILLNKTREEVAREHITRAEVRADMENLKEHVDNRFNRLEEKLDSIMRGKS